MSFLARAIATTGFSGYVPFAPGTVGAAVALLFLLGFGPMSPVAMLMAMLGLFFLGVWASGVAEKTYGHDAGKINIDEVVGMLCSVAFLPASRGVLIISFLVFRFLDVVKPFPANRCQSLPAGWGVMMDDVVAGVYTNLVVRVGLAVLA